MKLVKKSVITSLLIMGTVSLPVLAQAGDLYTSNNTKEYSTSIIHNPIKNICSATLLGNKGITAPGEQNHKIPENDINLACMSRSKCVADVYMTKDCSGPKIATVTFDVKTGIESIVMSSNAYKITGSGFNVQLNYA